MFRSPKQSFLRCIQKHLQFQMMTIVASFLEVSFSHFNQGSTAHQIRSTLHFVLVPSSIRFSFFVRYRPVLIHGALISINLYYIPVQMIYFSCAPPSCHVPRPACKFAWRSLALTISVDGDLVITTATTGTTRFEIIFMVFDQFQFSHRSVWHHSFNLDRRWWRHSQLKPIWPHSQYLVYFKCQQRFLKVRILLGGLN